MGNGRSRCCNNNRCCIQPYYSQCNGFNNASWNNSCGAYGNLSAGCGNSCGTTGYNYGGSFGGW